MIGTIFRIEHDNTGRGCYVDSGKQDNDWLKMMVHEHGYVSEDVHPCPREDIGIKRHIKRGDEFCGFKDMQQLHEWFTDEELCELELLGYQVVKIEDIEITAIGEKQVLFRKPAEKICENSENLLDIAV